MLLRRKPGESWLPLRIDNVETWQAGLLEQSAGWVGAVLAPAGRVHRFGFVGTPVTFRAAISARVLGITSAAFPLVRAWGER